MPTYARIPIAFERGEGAYLFTADGRRYLDFAAGIAVNALGHAHPHLVAALTEQAGKLWHVSNLYEIPESARLAERLAAHSFADRVFFCNSGAEAMEGVIKLARRYHYHAGHPERFRIITCQGSFHGHTLTTLSAAQNPKHIEGFGPITEGFDQVAFGNLNELRAAITPETGAILVEPIQGEGGVREASLDYLRALRAACDEFDLLLLFDEVQTGMGRTGKLFAYQWSDIAPDVMGLAKASLESSVRFIAADVGPGGTRVNGISAGPIKTLAAAGISGFRKMLHHVEEIAPLRKNVTIDDVGNAAAFLCSDLAGGITGEIIYVDAGFNTVGMTLD